jgi:hypothetical protein
MYTFVTRLHLFLSIVMVDELCLPTLSIPTVVKLPSMVLILARPHSVYALADSHALGFSLLFPFPFSFWLVASEYDSSSEFVSEDP